MNRATILHDFVRCALGCLVCTSVACGDEGDVVQPPIQWDLVWSDEFDGEANTPPDAQKWVHDVGTGADTMAGAGWGNNQLEFDTDRTSNVSLDGSGHLQITARKETYEGQEYTSGRINTHGRFSQQYGLFEARIRLPRGRAIWPAFWLLGDNYHDDGWPESGEIDIMEYKGQEPSKIHSSLHGPGYYDDKAETGIFRLPDARSFSDDFHTFAVQWDPGRIAWSVDGEVFQSVNTDAISKRGRWVFDHPFYIILNVAVGGKFVEGGPDDTTVFPQTMLVDYVRVFKRRL